MSTPPSTSSGLKEEDPEAALKAFKAIVIAENEAGGKGDW
jgi:hypothetical protein